MEREVDQNAPAEALGRLGAATVAEAGGVPLGPGLSPVRPGMHLCGPAFPVVCAPGDNLAIHVAVVEAPPGSVLAVSVGDLPARGYWGEVLTVAAVCAGLAGLVIDGCVRDTDTFERHSFPVFARGTALRGTSKDRGGTVGAPALVGGVHVRAGDWLVGDSDGVALVLRDQLETVVRAGEARQAKENGYFDALRTGGTTVQLLSLSAEVLKVMRPPAL